jgi:hypothetical protein
MLGLFFRLFNRAKKEVTYNQYRNGPTRPEFLPKVREQQEARAYADQVNHRQGQEKQRTAAQERNNNQIAARTDRIDQTIARADAVIKANRYQELKVEFVDKSRGLDQGLTPTNDNVPTKLRGKSPSIPTGQRPDVRTGEERDQDFLEEQRQKSKSMDRGR